MKVSAVMRVEIARRMLFMSGVLGDAWRTLLDGKITILSLGAVSVEGPVMNRYYLAVASITRALKGVVLA